MVGDGRRKEGSLLEDKRVEELAAEIHCGQPLAHDLLTLAGWDEGLVREASKACTKVESMKAFIIDHRFRKVER